MATNEHGRPQSRGTKLQVPEIPRLAAETVSSGAPGEYFFLDSPFNRTNIRLRWSRVVADARHSDVVAGESCVERRRGRALLGARGGDVAVKPGIGRLGNGRPYEGSS